MIQSPFLEEVNLCKGVMKKLRKKIYKFNINKQSRHSNRESTIKDAITVLGKRNLPCFLLKELQKYSDLTFSSLSGFSLNQMKPLSEISDLTNMQEQQIFDIYHKNKKTIKRRRNPHTIIKLNRQVTSAGDAQQSPVSSTSISSMFDDEIMNESSCSESNSEESQEFFEPLNNSNSFDQDFNNSDAMFQSTMLDFGNQIQIDSEEFLFKC